MKLASDEDFKAIDALYVHVMLYVLFLSCSSSGHTMRQFAILPLSETEKPFTLLIDTFNKFQC
jgi:hypothetical protein